MCEVTRDVITVLRAELEVSFSYFRLTNSLRVGVGSTPRGDTAGLTKLNLVCLLGWMTGESSSRTAVVLHSVRTGTGGPLSLTLFLWIKRSARSAHLTRSSGAEVN